MSDYLLKQKLADCEQALSRAENQAKELLSALKTALPHLLPGTLAREEAEAAIAKTEGRS